MENTTDTQEPEKEKSEAPSGQQYWWQNPLILTLLFAFIVGIFHFFFNRKKSKEVLIEKKVLLTLYKVNKRTFLKWVHFFCYTDTEEFVTYCAKRKVTEAEYNYILLCLGEPSDSMPVRTKGEIVDHTEGSYETLRSDILDNLDEVGISKKVYNSLNIFPPLIALRIRDYYQRNVENATVHSF